MDNFISWFVLLLLFICAAVWFVKAVIAEDERRRAENERGWLEYQRSLRGDF